MLMIKAKQLLSLMSFICVILITGCVDFEEIAKQQSDDMTEEPLTGEAETFTVSLGDINNDGKEEKLLLNETSLNLLSGSRGCEKFSLKDDYEYDSIVAYVVDIDSDSENEIIAMLWSNDSPNYDVCDVMIINRTDVGKYEVWEFPEEIQSNIAYSGIAAEVSVKDEFVYSVVRENYSVDVDVSRVYGLSMLEQEAYEKAQAQWKKISESDYQGEVIGIYAIHALHESNGEVTLNIYEYIVGGDDKVIGNLIFNIAYSATGEYQIRNVIFREKIDVMP